MTPTELLYQRSKYASKPETVSNSYHAALDGLSSCIPQESISTSRERRQTSFWRKCSAVTFLRKELQAASQAVHLLLGDKLSQLCRL
jgi:hypothetical protein